MFNKVLIANRGEIAVRVIRACRDLGISPVAIYSEVDRSALHVKLADEAFCVGPAASSESYLRGDRIIDVARRASAEAIHPGYGFLAENADFAQACEDSGIVFVGPSAQSIRLMGSKIASRTLVRKAGIPVVPGSERALGTIEDVEAAASAIGYPVLLKASAGGGGKGMRVVGRRSELASAFAASQGEALSAFGDGTVYIEKYLGRPRHIEVQILADAHGEVIHLGERECSIQRRHQKLVEESPSPALSQPLRRSLGESALSVARAAGYQNAGTVEFLADAAGPPESWDFYFLEMNTRLQVEHPVTELVTGVDLVHEQFRIADGQRLSVVQDQVEMKGAAIECRIYAEDPFENFLPSPGKMTTLFEPAGPGVRCDSGVFQGYRVPLEYDPLVSKLITYGNDRAQALARMRRAVREYKIAGVRTTLPLFRGLLSYPPFLAGELHTHLLEEFDLSSLDREIEEELQRTVAVAASLDYYSRRQSGEQPNESPRRSSWKEFGRRYWQ